MIELEKAKERLKDWQKRWIGSMRLSKYPEHEIESFISCTEDLLAAQALVSKKEAIEKAEPILCWQCKKEIGKLLINPDCIMEMRGASCKEHPHLVKL